MDTKRFELTDAEIGRIIGSLPDAANEVYPCLGGGYFHTCCHYQEVLKAQTRQDTLREVGEWLETKRNQMYSMLASISETNNVPAPISEAKKKAGTEPSPDRVEAVARELDKPVSCEDGSSHYIDESNEDYGGRLK